MGHELATQHQLSDSKDNLLDNNEELSEENDAVALGQCTFQLSSTGKINLITLHSPDLRP